MTVIPSACASFNPHPPLLAGETSRRACTSGCTDCFNPHPPLLAGETGHLGHGQQGTGVSIHTRHYWRVKLFVRRCKPCRGSCFNPHPPLLAGETMRRCPRCIGRICFNPHPPLLAGETAVQAGRQLHVAVSIHTRHYWRVKHSLQ